MARKSNKNSLLSSCGDNFCTSYNKWKQRKEYEVGFMFLLFLLIIYWVLIS